MIHSKIDDCGGGMLHRANDQFMVEARRMGMSLWRNADSGKFTDENTQRAYENWMKNPNKDA